MTCCSFSKSIISYVNVRFVRFAGSGFVARTTRTGFTIERERTDGAEQRSTAITIAKRDKIISGPTKSTYYFIYKQDNIYLDYIKRTKYLDYLVFDFTIFSRDIL